MSKHHSSSIEFIRYYDPNENAFSIAMPMGWQSQVSMERPYGIIRSCGLSVSPNGRTKLFFGDPTVPMFQAPNPMMFLFRGTNTGNPLKQVEHFIPAQHFMPNYVKRHYGNYPGFRILKVENNPFFQQHIIKQMSQFGLSAQVIAASVSFTFQENGETVYGKINGATVNMQVVWTVDINGMLTKDDPDEIEPLLNRMIASHQINPAWYQKENMRHQQVMNHNHQMRMQQRQNQFQAHQNRMQQMSQAADARNQQWRKQQAYNDQKHEQFIDYIRDETTITNGNKTAKVEAGYTNYYVNKHTGEYIGVNGYENPDPTIFERWRKKW